MTWVLLRPVDSVTTVFPSTVTVFETWVRPDDSEATELLVALSPEDRDATDTFVIDSPVERLPTLKLVVLSPVDSDPIEGAPAVNVEPERLPAQRMPERAFAQFADAWVEKDRAHAGLDGLIARNVATISRARMPTVSALSPGR